jgi:hypothetical protein
VRSSPARPPTSPKKYPSPRSKLYQRHSSRRSIEHKANMNVLVASWPIALVEDSRSEDSPLFRPVDMHSIIEQKTAEVRYYLPCVVSVFNDGIAD